MTGMDLSIIIVNWNAREYVRKCVDSIVTNPPSAAYEIIVIDSGSFDGTVEMLADEYPWVRAIQSAENLGFARANNVAVRHSAGRYLLFLNPDTEVIGESLAHLYGRMDSLPSVGALGCRLLNSDGSLQTSCVQSLPTILNQVLDAEVLRRRFPRSRLWGMSALFDGADGPSIVEAVSGACVMVARDAFDSVGEFNEDYFMYVEDIDLSYRLSRAGYRNYYVPDAHVVHHGGGSSGQAVSEFAAVMMREATWRFFCGTRGTVYAFGYRVGMALTAAVRVSLLAVAGVFGAGSRNPMPKWLATFKWAMKRERISSRYYRSQPSLRHDTSPRGVSAR